MDNFEGHTHWVTVQDCMGIPGFPSAAANVRKKLDLLASGNPGSKRKKEGTKASEYHVSILPGIAQAYFGTSPQDGESSMNTEEAGEDGFWWEAIYKALSRDEITAIISTFKSKGKTGIFPEELLTASELELASVSLSALNTALALEALPDTERKEILAKYGISKQTGPVAPAKEPHKKAG